MSPLSPESSETQARPYGLRSSTDQNLVPRLKSLEAQAEVQAREIALLQQLRDDLGSWRYRVDSASTQTADVLQALNRDLDDLKERVEKLQEGAVAAAAASAGRDALDELVGQMLGCYSDLQGTLEKIRVSNSESAKEGDVDAAERDSELQKNAGKNIQEFLSQIEEKITAAKAQTCEHDTENEFLRENGVKAAAEARAALIYAGAATEAAETAASEVRVLKLGLDVVEQSLEELEDATEAIDGLKSRVDDLDSGVERTSQQLDNISKALTTLRSTVDNAMVAATAADERARCAESDAAALRKEMKASGAAIDSAPPSPAPMNASDPKVKAAVHTLSDGYRSLHRAMVLMYEEQAEVAERVSAVGAAAATEQAKKEGRSTTTNKSDSIAVRAKKIRDSRSNGIFSYPLVVNISNRVSDEDEKLKRNSNHERNIDDLRILLSAQEAYISSQAKRTDALEEELRSMRLLLASLAPRADNSDASFNRESDCESNQGINQKNMTGNYTPPKRPSPTVGSLGNAQQDSGVVVRFQCPEVEDKPVQVSLEMNGLQANKFKEDKEESWKISSAI